MSGAGSELPVSLADVRRAALAIAGTIVHTPAVPARVLSETVGAELLLKLEILHPTGSFKERGALAKLLGLDDAARATGVIAMSAGNHAQGVAYHARRLGIPATIVMPTETPFTKIERTESFGARVVLRGTGLSEARDAARQIAAQEGLALVHPYDDLDVIAGQGTIALELLADHPHLEVIVVPVGGGGLISGIAVAAKALKPQIRIIGVQSALYPSMLPALGRRAPPSGGTTLAEGIAVKEPGQLTRAIVAALVDDVLLVDEPAIERATSLLVELQKVVVEGAGAVPLAAILDHPSFFRGASVALILSGGNIDARLLASILQRGLARAGRLVRLRIEISDMPGALAKIAKIIGACGANIVEIYHQRLFQDVPVKLAEVDAVLETRNAAHVGEVITALVEAGFSTRLLSNLALDGNN